MSEQQLEILGRYKILRLVGRGAMGVVYEAVDPEIDRVVAIKTINLTLSPSEMAQYEARFKQEIKAAGRLNHPNIVTIYDVGKTGDMAYMAMEFINGCELKDLLKVGEPLPVDIALDIIAQAAEGLAFAHSRDIIHRDVKPANIMLLENEDGIVAKITDFGIARMPASAVKTMTGMVMGSPRYMSPEQVVGRNLSARSDIFSLGVVLYEALTGSAPFESDTISSIMYQTVHVQQQPPSSMNPQIDPVMDAIIAKALAKEPEQRFDTMKTFARELKAVLRGRAGGAGATIAQLQTSAGMPAANLAPGVDDGTRFTPSLAGEATTPTITVPSSPSMAPPRPAPPPPSPPSPPPPAAPSPSAAPPRAATIPPAAPSPAPTPTPQPAPKATTLPPAAPPKAATVPPVATPSPVQAATRARAEALAAAESGERSAWPVAVANQFDSTAATLKLAEITQQQGEIAEFISASRQMPAFREPAAPPAPPPPKAAPTPPPRTQARPQAAAITLTMDAMPEARAVPMGPLVLLGSLAAGVVVLAVLLAATF